MISRQPRTLRRRILGIDHLDLLKWFMTALVVVWGLVVMLEILAALSINYNAVKVDVALAGNPAYIASCFNNPDPDCNIHLCKQHRAGHWPGWWVLKIRVLIAWTVPIALAIMLAFEGKYLFLTFLHCFFWLTIVCIVYITSGVYMSIWLANCEDHTFCVNLKQACDIGLTVDSDKPDPWYLVSFVGVWLVPLLAIVTVPVVWIIRGQMRLLLAEANEVNSGRGPEAAFEPIDKGIDIHTTKNAAVIALIGDHVKNL